MSRGPGSWRVAEAKITGKPQCFMVSRGPGATNGSIAIHVAQQDATPLVVLIGQVSREERGRGAFQEVDYTQFLGSMAKAVFEVSDPGKIGEIIVRAFHVAQTGVPGPVVIALPEDVLTLAYDRSLPQPFPSARPRASREDAERLGEMLGRAQRPLVIAGGQFRGERGARVLKRFAEIQQVPVAATWKNQDVFDNSSPLYAGHLGFGTPVKQRETLAARRSGHRGRHAARRRGERQLYFSPRARTQAAARAHLSRRRTDRARIPHRAWDRRRSDRACWRCCRRQPRIAIARRAWIDEIRQVHHGFHEVQIA